MFPQPQMVVGNEVKVSNGTLITNIPIIPIIIDSNDDFKNTSSINGWEGNGTRQSPYIIKNLTIYSLIISYTDVYFVVRECSINRSIELNHVENGVIENNTVPLGSDSVISGARARRWKIWYSSHINISNNNLINNIEEIYIVQSNDIKIFQNRLDIYTGIRTWSSNNIMIYDNIITFETPIGHISAQNCQNIDIVNNTMTNGDRIYFVNSNWSEISENNLNISHIELKSSRSISIVKNSITSSYFSLFATSSNIINISSNSHGSFYVIWNCDDVIIQNDSVEKLSVNYGYKITIQNTIIGEELEIMNTFQSLIDNNTIETFNIDEINDNTISNNRITTKKGALTESVIFMISMELLFVTLTGLVMYRKNKRD